MADKEITTFVIDISSSMSRSDGTRNISDLQLGLKYFNDVISSKIIRGRKTDYVTVISVHSPVTDNPYAGDSFQNIEVISEKIAPTYKDLKHFTGKLTANPTPNSEYNQDELGDCFEGVVLAVLLLKETLKLKFTRNIVLITNGESNITSMDTPLAQATYNAFTKLNINFTVIGIDFDKPAQTISETKQKNIASWQQVCKEHGGRLMTGSDALLSVLYNPPLRKVRPMKAFKGQLRFGADFQRLSMDKEYDPDTDAWSLSTNVECYPATKVELLPSGHSYFLRNNTNEISKIGQVREYFVTRDEEEGDEELGVRHSKLGAEDGDPEDGQQKSNETEAVDEEAVDYIEEFDRVKGFKYSNYDLIALDEDLEKESKLNTREGLDIVGFLKKDSFPFAYLTEEAFYVVPESNASLTRSVMSFNSFVQALLDIKCYCIVRYVQKDNSEVKMCILLPIKVFTNENEFVFTCSMVRIPFKEDEKIGRFPFLTTKALATGKSGEGEDDGEVDESPQMRTHCHILQQQQIN